MKTKSFISLLLVVIATVTFATAQPCNQARDLADKLIEVLQTEQTKRTSKKKLKKLSASETVRIVKEKWNIIAGNSPARMGARKMFLDNSTVKGTVIGRTQRTFISPPSRDRKIKITLEKTGGKAKTEIYVCVHSSSSPNAEQRKAYVFENSEGTSTKTFTLNNVLGKMVSVIVRGKSVGNTFKYKMKAKKAEL